MKKIIVLVCVLSIILTGTVFAGGRQAAEAGAHAFVFKSTGNPFGERVWDGFREAIESYGYTAIFRAPVTPTVEGQIQIIEQLIAQRVASIGIAGNDFDALQPALARARTQGIYVFSVDSAVNAASRNVHINQADTHLIAMSLVEAAYDILGGAGEFAILSATSTAPNQNAWIAGMQEIMAAQPRFANLNLVRVAFGDDLRDRSTSETQALLASFPNLRLIVAPTTVGIAAAARVITDQGLIGQVYVSGLGLPSEMLAYIENGATPYMYLWNPIDMGYLGGHAAVALTRGTMTGAVGNTFTAGRLPGTFNVIADPAGGTEVILGPPFRFDTSNIRFWAEVY